MKGYDIAYFNSAVKLQSENDEDAIMDTEDKRIPRLEVHFLSIM